MSAAKSGDIRSTPAFRGACHRAALRAGPLAHAGYKLAKHAVPINIGKISTNMVWHHRNDMDKKHAWRRQQIKDVYENL